MQQDECYAVRAAALRFLAVVMTASSFDAACEADPHLSSLPHNSSDTPPQHTVLAADARFQPDMTKEEAEALSSQQSASARPGALTARASSRTGLAGPLMLQSSFAAQYYTQDIWDFGIEQLLLQGSFWEQLLPLLQVWSPLSPHSLPCSKLPCPACSDPTLP